MKKNWLQVKSHVASTSGGYEAKKACLYGGKKACLYGGKSVRSCMYGGK